MEVKFSNPEQMNLLGYFLRDLLKTSLTNEKNSKIARQLHSAFLFDANGMAATVTFRKDAVEIQQGNTADVFTKISGELNALLDVTFGESYLKYLLTGKIRIRGNVLKLLKLLKILRVTA